MGVSAVLLLVPSGLEMRDRLLPFWYFGIHLLAGLAVGHGVKTYLEDRSGKALATAVGVGVLLVALFVLRDVSTVRRFAASSLRGFEAQEAWPMHERLIEAVTDLPPGRVLWQSDSTLSALGSVNAPALLPYWSSDHPTLHGLLVESSRSAPFTLTVLGEVSPAPAKPSFRGWPEEARYDLEAGVAHMAYMGVRYYVTFTDQAAAAAQVRPNLRLVESDEGFAVWEVAAQPLITPARSVPTVQTGRDFDQAARSWFHRTERLTEWLVESGPSDWPRGSGDPTDWAPPPAVAQQGEVTAIADDGDRIEFRTSAVGVPHLVRVSFFPNWRARGADGPYRAAPSFMVVVPTQETVVLSFEDTWVEWTGRILTGAALAWLLIQAAGRLRARTTAREERGSP
jgi:hypothetical protein